MEILRDQKYHVPVKVHSTCKEEWDSFFTTPYSNVISDDMMSRLMLSLIKQLPENQFTHLYKNLKSSVKNARFWGTIFCCRRKCYMICWGFFPTRCVFFFRRHIFHPKKSRLVKIVWHILKSVFHKKKTCQNCKFRWKKKSYWIYIFTMSGENWL